MLNFDNFNRGIMTIMFAECDRFSLIFFKNERKNLKLILPNIDVKLEFCFLFIKIMS